MKNVLRALLAAILAASVLHATTPTRLASELDCLREKHLAVVAAHRGQPDPSAAENAMSSFRATRRRHPAHSEWFRPADPGRPNRDLRGPGIPDFHV